MLLFSLLAALLLERTISHINKRRLLLFSGDYVRWWLERLSSSFWDSSYGVLAMLFPPVFLVALFQAWLDGGVLSLLGWAFAVAILLLSLGPGDLDADLERYTDAVAAGNDEQAVKLARAITGEEMLAVGNEQTRLITEAVFVQANSRIFGVLFWFIVLGPMGAVLFRATHWLGHELRNGSAGLSLASEQLLWVINWLPARILAITFSLAGNFERVISGWRRGADKHQGLGGTEQFLGDIGFCAIGLNVDDEVENLDWLQAMRTAMSLVWRSMVIWIFVIAVATLASWMS